MLGKLIEYSFGYLFDTLIILFNLPEWKHITTSTHQWYNRHKPNNPTILKKWFNHKPTTMVTSLLHIHAVLWPFCVFHHVFFIFYLFYSFSFFFISNVLLDAYPQRVLTAPANLFSSESLYYLYKCKVSFQVELILKWFVYFLSPSRAVKDWLKSPCLWYAECQSICLTYCWQRNESINHFYYVCFCVCEHARVWVKFNFVDLLFEGLSWMIFNVWRGLNNQLPLLFVYISKQQECQ